MWQLKGRSGDEIWVLDFYVGRREAIGLMVRYAEDWRGGRGEEERSSALSPSYLLSIRFRCSFFFCLKLLWLLSFFLSVSSSFISSFSSPSLPSRSKTSNTQKAKVCFHSSSLSITHMSFLHGTIRPLTATGSVLPATSAMSLHSFYLLTS